MTSFISASTSNWCYMSTQHSYPVIGTKTM